jgi:hypothetical protein
MDGLSQQALAALDGLTTAEGWPLASAAASDDEPVGRFAALFGRDALITSLQVLPARPAMATATLAALAGRRGARVEAETGEEPGKILHEERELASPGRTGPRPGRRGRCGRWRPAGTAVQVCCTKPAGQPSNLGGNGWRWG